MIAEIFPIAEILYSCFQGLFMVFVSIIKFLFTMPFLPFTLLAIATHFIEHKHHI